MQDQVHATALLKQLGVSPAHYKNGAAGVLKELARLNIKPISTIPFGRGVAFMVAKKDADIVISASKKIDEEEDKPLTYNRARKDIRSVARAILDLYRRLGEEPHSNNRIIEIAERDKD